MRGFSDADRRPKRGPAEPDVPIPLEGDSVWPGDIAGGRAALFLAARHRMAAGGTADRGSESDAAGRDGRHHQRGAVSARLPLADPAQDRKSTRLNSSHANISY